MNPEKPLPRTTEAVWTLHGWSAATLGGQHVHIAQRDDGGDVRARGHECTLPRTVRGG